jgi:hypothetical protein
MVWPLRRATFIAGGEVVGGGTRMQAIGGRRRADPVGTTSCAGEHVFPYPGSLPCGGTVEFEHPGQDCSNEPHCSPRVDPTHYIFQYFKLSQVCKIQNPTF